MRVLIADDSVVSRRLLQASLEKWDYEVLSANDGAEAWEILSKPDAPTLAILDWMMPGMTGVEICRLLRQNPREPYIYVILLTSRNQTEDVVEGMNAGADDYLSKPFSFQELQVRLRAGRRIVDLQAELLEAREHLREQATHDALTGLINRGTILEMLHTELSRAERTGSPLGVILLDLDRFKTVNDNFGHATGDAVLRVFAERMRRSIRSYDVLGRYGGEEFLLLLPGAESSDIRNQALRMKSVLASEPIAFEEKRLQITASFGATAYEPGCTPDILLNTADIAMYESKRLGRNRVTFLLPSAVADAGRSAGVARMISAGRQE